MFDVKMDVPQAPLYRSEFEHDNCGIGACVNIKGVKSRDTVENALKIVENLEHRAGTHTDEAGQNTRPTGKRRLPEARSPDTEKAGPDNIIKYGRNIHSLPDSEKGRLRFSPKEEAENSSKDRKELKKKQAVKFSSETGQEAEDTEETETELAGTEKELELSEKTGRLRFEGRGEKTEKPKSREKMKKQMAAKFSATAEKPAATLPAESKKDPAASMETSRLRFTHEEEKPENQKNPKSREKAKKQMAAKFSAAAEKPAATLPAETKTEPETSAESGRLWFTHEDRKEGLPKKRTADKQKMAAKFSAEPAKQENAPRLHYDRSELPPEERRHAAAQKEAAPETGKQTGVSRQQRQYEKAQQRVETASGKLEKAQSKLPTRRRAHLQKQYDSESGKVKRRLQFDSEVIPEYEKPPLPKRAGKALGRTVTTGAVMKLHQKVRETEHDNVAVEAAHKTEFAAERATGRVLRWNKRRLHDKPYREVRRAEKSLAKANADMAYRKLLADNPQLQKKSLSKWFQRQKLKRKYAAAAREAAKGAQHTTNVLTATGQVIRAIAQKIATNKAVLGIVAVAILIVAMCGSLLSSCSSILTGVQSAVLSTCYTAADSEIEQSELRYTELETDLQRNINNTETDYPDYDEYRYSIGEIGHNPYELMGYLSAKYGDFTYAQVEAELNRLFGEQYQLTRTAITEVRTYTDEEGVEQQYDWHVLQTTLTVRPLSEIIAGSLAPGEQTDLYGVYLQTCGNRQCYGNPFDFAWIPYVTSPYGYRVHPTSGAKDLHRGVDIGVAAGTAIKAAQDGRVLSAGNAGDYGLCVVIEGENGYRSRYAHCSSLSVSAGQEVKRGDTIAYVGSTGNSTGPHLHLEVTHNGQYLNPYYYVDNGGSGYLPGGGAAGVQNFPENPGAPMGDGSFEAMLTEAEKYLGFPYVWGGSSPATSFDCSGFVSWVVNQSGVGSVGRQTAQGLYNLCTPVSKENMQPGDLIFFTGTYSAATPVTHVGIYVGGGRMIHCGDPISYANINSNYWNAHFYSGGRLR